MAEPSSYTFGYREIAEMLIKHQGIHEGFWGIVFELGIGGGMSPFPPGSDTIVPVAVVPIKKIGIQRFDEPNALTIDAAEVTRAPGEGPKKKAGHASD